MKVHSNGKPITLWHIIKGIKGAVSLFGGEVLDIPIEAQIVEKDGNLLSFVLTDMVVTDGTVQINGRLKK